MAEVAETITIVNKKDLPDELASYEGFAKNSRGQWEGVHEDGSTKRIEHLGDLLMKTLVQVGAAEQSIQTPEEKIAHMEARIRELEEKSINDSARPPIIPDIQQAIERAVTEKTQELQSLVESLKQDVGDLQQQKENLVADNARLQAQLDEIRSQGLDNPDHKVDKFGFTPGEEVVIHVGNGKFEGPYKVENGESEEEKDIIVISDSSGQKHKVSPEVVRKKDQVDSTAIQPTKVPSPDGRRRYVPTETFWRNLRGHMPWDAERRDWYVDDKGPYYLDDEGKEVYVSRAEVEGRRTSAAAIAGAMVVGAVLWELVGEKLFGFGEGSSTHLKEVIHNQSIQMNDLHKLNDHLSQVDKHIHNELWHDHKHELRKITDLQNQVHDLHSDVIHEKARDIRDSGTYWSIRYPWDWAANKVGSLKAEGWLHMLGARAQEHGHKVMWFHNQGKEIIQVDGSTNTARVVGILSRYQ